MLEAEAPITRKTRNVKRLKDESGKVFGKLTVLRPEGLNQWRAAMFLCRCECGSEVKVAGSSLRSGNTQSCGFCHASDHVFRPRQRHGLTESPEYLAWQAMKNRCYREKDDHFHRYGGRGITVCTEWRDDFEAFLAHVGLRPSPKHSLHRLDNDGNYEIGNVAWETKRTQCNTRSSNRFLEHDGKRQTLMEWSRETGLGHTTIWFRIKMGWSVADALTRPLRGRCMPPSIVSSLG